MSFPLTPVNTVNLESELDSPALARVDLLDAVQKLNTIINGANTAGNVALLTASGRLDGQNMSTNISCSGTQVIAPSSGVVNIQSVLRLPQLSTETILAFTSNVAGDIAFCSNVGNVAANPGLAIFNGNVWVGLPLTANVFVTL